MKKFIVLILAVSMLALTSCQPNSTIAVSGSKPNSQSQNSIDLVATAVSKPAGTPVMPLSNEIITTKNYLSNDQIPVGKNADIIARQGIFNTKSATFKGKSFYTQDVDFLGMDSNNNIIIDDNVSGEIDSIDRNYKVTTVLNYLGNRKNHMYTISMCGDIVAWSECPYGNDDPSADATNGAGWELYFANLKTKKNCKNRWV